mgnify:CR=1 FL=1
MRAHLQRFDGNVGVQFVFLGGFEFVRHVFQLFFALLVQFLLERQHLLHARFTLLQLVQFAQKVTHR